jgi:hypothetical protein
LFAFAAPVEQVGAGETNLSQLWQSRFPGAGAAVDNGMEGAEPALGRDAAPGQVDRKSLGLLAVSGTWNGPYYKQCGFVALSDKDLTAGLRLIRQREAAHGLDRWPRMCMRRDL